ncbi:MAG: ROK family protein [Parcubacteria group bacterium]|nr:ROK family protein [Parcubacteria group bacterium]
MHILFDLGKTKLRIAGTRTFESFLEPQIFNTPTDYDDTIALIAKVAKEISTGDSIDSIAGGAGAPITADKKEIVEGVNFPGWGGRSFVDDLSRACGAPIHLENDAALVGLGEAVYGAGRDSDIVAYITVSTGLGGARIVNGRIDANVYGFEPGWQVLSISGGEKYASDFLAGNAIEKTTGKKPYETTDLAFWDEKARILAHLLNNVIVMWSPNAIILGGSMMKEIGIPIPATEKYLKEILHIFPELPAIRKAKLADIGGLWGAMEFLKGKH